MVIDARTTFDRNLFRNCGLKSEEHTEEKTSMSSSTVGNRNLLRLNIEGVKRNSDILNNEENQCSTDNDNATRYETDVNRNSIVDKPVHITAEDVCEVTTTEITERKTRKKNSAISSFRSLVKTTVISSELSKNAQNQELRNKTVSTTESQIDEDVKLRHTRKKKTSTGSREKKLRKKRNRRSRAIQNEGAPLWTPIEDCCWRSVGGRTVKLEDIPLNRLCDAEKRALKRLAISRLHEYGSDCQITIPKALGKPTNPVFSIELFQVIENDKAVEKAHQAVMAKLDMVGEEPENIEEKQTDLPNDFPSSVLLGRRNSDPILMDRDNLYFEKTEHDETDVSKYMLNALRTIDTLKEEEEEEELLAIKRKSRLIEALTLSSTSASSMCILDRETEFKPPSPQVPKVMIQAVDYLTKYALNTIGIFRTGGSKKRVRQMKKDYDSGHACVITEDSNPHDVAALFKEFLRCLPEPLLTRELYPAFLSCSKRDYQEDMFDIIKPLVWLLPVPNRDTLELALHCLRKVADNALDREDEDGNLVSGNKMDSQNLATLMAPNILHRCKSYKNPQAYQVDGSLNTDDNKCSIEVVESMIANNEDLFQISADEHHAVLSILLEVEPETVDYVLRKKSTITNLDVQTTDSVENDIILSFNVNGRRPSSAGPRTKYSHEEITFQKSNSFNHGPYKPFVRRRKNSTDSRPTSTKSDPDRNSLRKSGLGTPPNKAKRKSSKVFADLESGRESESPRDSGVVISSSTPPFQRNSLRSSFDMRASKPSESPTTTAKPLIILRQQSRDRDSRDSAYDSGMQGMFSNRNTASSIHIITDEQTELDLDSSQSDFGSPKSPVYLSDVLDTPSFVPMPCSPKTAPGRKISLPAFPATGRQTTRMANKSNSMDGNISGRPNSLASTKTGLPIDWVNDDTWPAWDINPRESQFPTQETTL